MNNSAFDFDQWAALARMDMAKFEQRRKAALDALCERIGGKDLPYIAAVRRQIEAEHANSMASAAVSAQPAKSAVASYVTGSVPYTAGRTGKVRE